MKKYVLGFAFDRGLRHVLLIRKNHPEKQKGKLNGIGGHIKDGERPVKAMMREFSEEAGRGTYEELWQPLIKISDKMRTYKIYIFFAFMDIDLCRTMTDEVLQIIPVGMLDHFDVMPDLQWLIPMALNEEIKEMFSIKEAA
jgi:8-oxo-dGTP diphosphatase